MEPPQKRARASETAPDPTPRACAICLLDSPPAERPTTRRPWALRERHGCSTCTSDGWCICEDCHDSLLSRQCPICRSDYAPRLLYPFPTAGLSLPTTDVRSVATRQVLAMAVMNSNAVVWDPAERVGSFCMLPGSAEGNFVTVTRFRVPEGLLDQDGEYRFTNSLWEALLADAEAREDSGSAEDDEPQAGQDRAAQAGQPQQQQDEADETTSQVSFRGAQLVRMSESELVSTAAAAREYEHGFICDGCETRFEMGGGWTVFHQSEADGDGWDLCARCAADPAAAERRMANREASVSNGGGTGVSTQDEQVAEAPPDEVVDLVVGWLSADPSARITARIADTGPRLLLTDKPPAKIESLMGAAREKLEQMRQELATVMRNAAAEAQS